jgi:DNA mismatch repair ATPase MutS
LNEIEKKNQDLEHEIALLEEEMPKLKDMKNEFSRINPFTISISKLNDLGYLFKCYHDLHINKEYEHAIRYSIGFEGYINNLLGLFENIRSRNISIAKFTKKNCAITDQYYPPYANQTHVKNSCNFDKNMIITGVNASGKTTMLKTTTINIIFTQQFGFGFYKSFVLNPYTHIHSYLNIPDTSERDSLFQAESRRCKEIIDIINENPDKTQSRHFCIFDELYSGTNPDEAVQAGKAFLTYLSKYPNVRFMLTTHYVKICKHFKKSNVACNYKMVVDVLPDGNFDYKYKMKKGISKLKGGIRVLKDMDYPAEILADLM